MNEQGKHNFLRQVAATTYQHYEGKLEDVTFVFPNRRSGLFFQRYLGEEIATPIFSPKIITITQLFEQLASLTPTDPFSLLLKLYLVYKQHTLSEESFDTFMYWGQMLLADFDDIAKYDVDARLLFDNLHDLKLLDASFDYLTDEQKKVIRAFWEQFEDSRFDSKARGKFWEIWTHLADIMTEFNNALLEARNAYPGLIQREAVKMLYQGLRDAEIIDRKMVFVGFNALTLCEHRLFSYYKKHAQTLFFWDYNGRFLSDEHNIASKFRQENLTDFPQTLNWEHTTPNTTFSLIAVPSLIGQGQYVRTCLEKDLHNEKNTWIDTAIVLPEESLLMPVLQAVPEEVQRINVTMGYPLSATDVMSFLDLLCDIRRKQRNTKTGIAYYHKTVTALLKHKYVKTFGGNQLDETYKEIVRENRIYVSHSALPLQENVILNTLFTTDDSLNDLQYILHVWNTLRAYISENDLLQEERPYIDQACIITQRLADLLLLHPEVAVQRETIYAVLKQYMQSATIPFRGEPLDGLQVMGLLETRALDFKKVVILAANEGSLPRTQNANSFIPYNLRKGYGLPTFEEHDAIMAYNFYRLISNAEQVHLVYDSRSSKESTNEMSRYIWQLKYQYDLSMKELVIAPEVKLAESQQFTLTNSEFIQECLNAYCIPRQQGGRSLSASALNMFLECPTRFYFTHLCGLSQADEVKEEIEADMFGTLYHEVMEFLYKPYVGKTVQSTDVLKMKQEVDSLLHKAYATNVLKNKSGKVEGEIGGNHSLVLQVIKEYLIKQLENDLQDTPFDYIAPEKKFVCALDIEQGKRMVNLVGYVDRIDCKNDEIRIIDYKTGKVDSLQFTQVADMLDSSLGKKRPTYALQTMLYAWFYMKEFGKPENKHIVPYIASLRSFYSDEPLKGLKIAEDKNITPLTDYAEWNEEFEKTLREWLENNIFSPHVTFSQTEDVKKCEYCPFTDLCGR